MPLFSALYVYVKRVHCVIVGHCETVFDHFSSYYKTNTVNIRDELQRLKYTVENRNISFIIPCGSSVCVVCTHLEMVGNCEAG